MHVSNTYTTFQNCFCLTFSTCKEMYLYLSSRSSLSWCPCGKVNNSNPEETPIILCISVVTPNILATWTREINTHILYLCFLSCQLQSACFCLHLQLRMQACVSICVCVCANSLYVYTYLAVDECDVFSCSTGIDFTQQLFDSLQDWHLQRLIFSRK